MSSSSEDRFLLDQLVGRIGHKRALSALQQAEPEEYAAALHCPMLDLIASDALLAHVLSRCWQEAHKLFGICKRFAAALRKPEFWMLAVQQMVRRRLSTDQHWVVPLVNPFFRFPEHVWSAPTWPWWHFLAWLFPRGRGNDPRRYLSVSKWEICIYQGKTVLIFDYRPRNNSAGSVCVIYDDDADNSRWRSVHRHSVLTWIVVKNGKYCWVDGVLDLRCEAQPPHRCWCGAVTEDKTNELILIPTEGEGFYRDP